jgi:hypothetical protein
VKSILLAATALVVATQCQAGTVYVPEITFIEQPGFFASLFGAKPKPEAEPTTLDAERSQSACEAAIYNFLEGDFDGVVFWRCRPTAVQQKNFFEAFK